MTPQPPASSTSNINNDVLFTPFNDSTPARWKRILDVAIIVVVYAYNLPIAFSTHDDTPHFVAVALIFAAVCLPFLWRRHYPRAIFFITALAVSVHLLLKMGPAVADIMLVLTLCSLTVRTRWQDNIGPAIVTVVLILIATYEPFVVGYLSIGEIGFVIVAVLLAYSWATVLRVYRQYVDSLHQRAIDAEQAHKDRELMIMAEERQRIARELHDVVSHSLSSMIALSDGALATYNHNPQQAHRAIEHLNNIGREALDEMRTILSLLRSDDHDALSPQPGIADIDDLLTSVRHTGIDIEAHLDGDVDHLNPGLQLTIYRILQESLTNVYKHAGPGSAVQVTITSTPKEISLVVTNSAPKHPLHTPLPPSGYGLQGMRERVRLFNGEVHAGPRAHGGFEVTVTIPQGASQ